MEYNNRIENIAKEREEMKQKRVEKIGLSDLNSFIGENTGDL